MPQILKLCQILVLRLTFYPLPRIAPHVQPRTGLALVLIGPAHLDVAEDALRVGHEGGEAAIWGGDCGEAAGAAIGVGGV